MRTYDFENYLTVFKTQNWIIINIIEILLNIVFNKKKKKKWCTFLKDTG